MTGKIQAARDVLSSADTDIPLPEEGPYKCPLPIARALQTMAEVEWFRSERTEVTSDLPGQGSLGTTEGISASELGVESATSPPYMQVPIEDVQVRCGEVAKFHAIIQGNPQPVVGWFKGISLLLDSEKAHQYNQGTSYSLFLYNTTADDGGVYTCMAKNTGGEVLCKAELVVQEDKKSQEAKKPSTRRKLHSFYEVKQEIGRGSFSILKRVIHKDSRVSYAAKFIPLRSRSREQVYQEREILVKLSHDRIIQLLDQFETRKTLILILELCSNEELLDRLYKKNLVTEVEVKFYLKQLLEGILYLHNNQILHLDIKPSNILMVYDDREDIKICDFGFSQKINPSEPQYSMYGSPEFVSPEILSRSPVSTASDIWPVGVICYLSLTCKSPFAGENDRATLLNIQRGSISWDSPDWGWLSKEAKAFISKILQPSPEARPSATECLSNMWFMHDPPPEETHFIDTKPLKFFVSRSKWQRSLMSYKSVLVMRSIPEILEKHKNTSLGISRQLVETSSSSSTSGSSSDNEISVSPGKRPFGPVPELHLSVLEGPEYAEFGADGSLPPGKATRPKQTSARGQMGRQAVPERERAMSLEPERSGEESSDFASSQDTAGLMLPKQERMERSPGCVPRHSVVKSTFYSQPSDSLADVPSSPGKEQRKHLERAKRTYRKVGYSKSALSGLREPLLEQFELGREGGEFGSCREGDASPQMTKSASFDTAQKTPKFTSQVSRRSRSLDDYRMRATSFPEEQDIAEEDMDIVPQEDLAEETYSGDEESLEPKSRKGFSEGQPMGLALGGEEHSALPLQKQGKVSRSAQHPEKGEGLPQTPKKRPPVGRPPQGGKKLILTAQESDLASGEIMYGTEEEQNLESHLQKGENSAWIDNQPEITPISHGHEKEKLLFHQTKLSSAESREGPKLIPRGSPAPSHTLPVQAEKPLTVAKGKSPEALQTMGVGEGQSLMPQKPLETTTLQSKHSGLPTGHTDTSASLVPEGKEQILSQKSSMKLEKEGRESPNVLQAKDAPVSVSKGTKQKHLHLLPAARTDIKLPVVKGEGPARTEMVSLGEDQYSPQGESSVYSELPSSTLRGAASFIQTASQMGAPSISMPHGETHWASLPKPSIHHEGEPLLRDVQRPPQPEGSIQTLVPPQGSLDRGHGKSLKTSGFASAVPKGQGPQISMAPQAKTDLTSVFETEKPEVYYHTPPVPIEVKSTVLKGQTPLILSFSEAKMRPSSTSGGKFPATWKKTSDLMGEGRSREHMMHQKLLLYSDPEAEALESRAEEMVFRSKGMTPLAEGSKRHVSPPPEMFYQGSPGQAVRPQSRYLVRRGKREGGIGLADPSEAGVLYPGEEDSFGEHSYLSKKARMSSSDESQGPDYIGISQFPGSGFEGRLSYPPGSPGSHWRYQIALVQIQDLSELPRPDSKTAKFDISEVEPAFLNLHELYDIAYSPFEFLSFRKAPEKLPSKRSWPPGLKLHAQQGKKLRLREGEAEGEAARETFTEEERGPPEVEVGSQQDVAPRRGRKSDSEGDLPLGSQQTFDLPSDPSGERRRSLQAALGFLKPVSRSQSMELAELSLKKRMKASVAQFSRMLTRKLSSEEHREDPEEHKREQPERTSLTESSPRWKKKTMFPSFSLPSLKMKEKEPSFIEELTDQTVALGQTLTLSCRTSTHSLSHVEWFKDGAGIRSTDRILISSTLKHFQILTILSATPEDFGTYTCVAAGSHGTISTSCTIRKSEAPSNPPPPDILEVLEDGVELAWEPVELTTPVTYTVLCKKDDGEWKTLVSDISDCHYTVEHLPPQLVYSFRVACVSSAGVGPYSSPTAKVKIGEKNQTAFQSQDTEDRMTAPAQPTHQTYAFQTEIKRGRFSIIKHCREKFSGNPLAAKIIPYRQEDKEAVLQEYHVLQKLHHANIAQLQGAYVSPRHLVLIEELCAGPELFHVLARRSSYSEVEVRDYLWQMLSAVEYLHEQNILHLDLRSENMIIIEPNLLKLLDFGNAQFYTPDRIITLEGCTDHVETMASELLSDKGAVPQSDIWAVGVTAFIMLSAEYPISSEAACDFGRFVKRDKIRLNKCYAGLSGGAISFLQSTLSLNPWRRPTATECLQSSWLQETGLDEHQHATVTFSTAKLKNFVAEREKKRALLCSKYGVMTV